MRRSHSSKALLVRTRRTSFLVGTCLLIALSFGCNGTVHPNGAATQTAGRQSLSISGSLSPAAGGSGATLSLSGASTATVTANSSGAYTFTGLAPGLYAVTPSHTGFTFNPAAQAATITTSDLTGINFTATALTGSISSISGTITPALGGGGATIILSGPSAATTTTNASGSYTLTGLPNGTYTVTPNRSGFTFIPASHSVTLTGTNQTGIDFTATAGQAHAVLLNWNASASAVAGYNIYRSTASGRGYTQINSSLVTSLDYTDSNVQAGTTYFYVATAVDASGNESVDSNQATAVVPQS